MLKALVGNLLAEPGAVVGMTPAADGLFPASFLTDGPGQLGARFGSLSADPRVDITLNAVPNGDGSDPEAESGDRLVGEGGGETGALLESDWTTTDPEESVLRVEMGDALFSATNDHDGNGLSLYGQSDADPVTFAVPMELRGGATYTMQAWAQKALTEHGEDAPDVDDGDVYVRLYDPDRARWLSAAGVWEASAQNLVTAPTFDTYVEWGGINAGAGVEFAAPGQSGRVTLQLQLVLTNHTTAGRFDGITIVPDVDFMGVFNGHNIPIGATVQWITADTAAFGSPTTRGTFTVAHHQFFLQLDDPISAAYHRLVVSGTPAEPYWMSDLVMGLLETFAREPQDGVSIEYEETGQIRQRTPGGSRRIQNRGPYPQRRLAMKFRFADAAEEAAFRAFVVDALRGGAESVVLIPAPDLVGLAIYGDIEQPLRFQHSMRSGRQAAHQQQFDYYSDMELVVVEGAGFEIV